MAELTFDATQVVPQGDFTPLPAGEYLVAIIESEMKDTKSGNGRYLELKMQVLDGEHKGRFVFDRLNLVNPNEQAVDIARKTLSAICHAVNNLKIKDSVQLHNIPMVAKVAVKTRQDNGEPANEVKGYRSKFENAPIHPQPPTQTQQQPQQPQQPSGPAPWR
jgi:hypothetical protein